MAHLRRKVLEKNLKNKRKLAPRGGIVLPIIHIASGLKVKDPGSSVSGCLCSRHWCCNTVIGIISESSSGYCGYKYWVFLDSCSRLSFHSLSFWDTGGTKFTSIEIMRANFHYIVSKKPIISTYYNSLQFILVFCPASGLLCSLLFIICLFRLFMCWSHFWLRTFWAVSLANLA